MRLASTASIVWSVVRWRWWIVLLAGLLYIGLEMAEHLTTSGFDAEFLPTVSRYGIALPFATGILLSVLEKAMSESQTKAIRTERRRIARELHDTLGQDLGYLHLKMEYLLSNDTLDSATLQELDRMRVIVDDAYQQIRGTLVKLDSGDATDVAAALFDHARSLGRRSNFQVDFATEGRPYPLSIGVQLQVLSIFREALVNVEKHAHAHRVHLRFHWARDALTVHLMDDGHGFETTPPPADGHLGLRIMTERALEIGAHLAVTSHPNAGTQIALLLPYRPTGAGAQF